MQKALDAGVMSELPWKGFDLKEYSDFSLADISPPVTVIVISRLRTYHPPSV